MSDYLDKIHATLADYLGDEMVQKRSALEKLCESPIEIALALALYFLDRTCQHGVDSLIIAAYSEISHYRGCGRLLVPQYQLDDKRIDFWLFDRPIRVFIECDGHDFHERTKEQAARDRRRDRQIQQSGAPILRFTGSEIYADPVACAEEIFEIVSDLHMCDHIARTA